MQEISLKDRLIAAKNSLDELRGIFDLSDKESKLKEINLELENPEVWQDQEKAKILNKEKSF